MLSWDDPVRLHGESVAPSDDRGRGFLLRLHADPACGVRLSPDTALVAKDYDEVRAEVLCAACGTGLVPASRSSVARRLREAERTLLTLRQRIGGEPLPREIVHCVALRYEATSAVSVHPDVPQLAARVAALATGTADALRDSLEAFQSHRSAASGR